MTNSLKLLATVVIASVLSACATSTQSGSHCVAASGSLDHLKTMIWVADQPIKLDDRTGYVADELLADLEASITTELASKGVQLLADDTLDSDLQIQVVLNVRRELFSTTHEVSPCRDNDCWERIDFGSASHFDIRTTGFLAADIYVSGKPVWRGWVERTLHPRDRARGQVLFNEAVPKLFESYPP